MFEHWAQTTIILSVFKSENVQDKYENKFQHKWSKFLIKFNFFQIVAPLVIYYNVKYISMIFHLSMMNFDQCKFGKIRKFLRKFKNFVIYPLRRQENESTNLEKCSFVSSWIGYMVWYIDITSTSALSTLLRPHAVTTP